MITVSMPVHGHNPTRAVESVLAQTYDDLRVIVVEDGADCGPLPEDPRVVRFRLPTNRGRYYADAVTLSACDTEYWTPHDSDDWSDPRRFELQQGLSFCHCVYHNLDGTKRADPVRTDRARPGQLRTIARYPAGVYPTDIAKTVGIDPQSRGSFDTAFVALIWQEWDPAVIEEPLYHVHKRRGSLTTDRVTGMGTEWRRQQRQHRRKLYNDARARPVSGWADVMAGSPGLRAAVAADAERLRMVLEDRCPG